MTSIETERSRPADRAEEAALVARMASGDEAALAELYDRYRRLVFGLALRILKKSAQAEETLQEVFLQAWNQAERYDARRSSVSTWLSLITRSRAIDRLRTRQVVDRTHATFREEVKKGDRHTSSEGPGSVLHEQRRRRLREALAELPPDQRDVLEKAYFGGMTQSEISRTTDVPLGTVKTRTLLALRKLRDALHDDIDELL